MRIFLLFLRKAHIFFGMLRRAYYLHREEKMGRGSNRGRVKT